MFELRQEEENQATANSRYRGLEVVAQLLQADPVFAGLYTSILTGATLHFSKTVQELLQTPAIKHLIHCVTGSKKRSLDVASGGEVCESADVVKTKMQKVAQDMKFLEQKTWLETSTADIYALVKAENWSIICRVLVIATTMYLGKANFITGAGIARSALESYKKRQKEDEIRKQIHMLRDQKTICELMKQIQPLILDDVLEKEMCDALLSPDYAILAYADHEGVFKSVVSNPTEIRTPPNYAVYLGTTNTLQHCSRPVITIDHNEDLQENTRSQLKSSLPTAYKLPVSVKARAVQLLTEAATQPPVGQSTQVPILLLKHRKADSNNSYDYYVLLCMNIVFEDICVMCLEDVEIAPDDTTLKNQPCIVSCRHVFHHGCVSMYDENARKHHAIELRCPSCNDPMTLTHLGEVVCNGAPDVGFKPEVVEVQLYLEMILEQFASWAKFLPKDETIQHMSQLHDVFKMHTRSLRGYTQENAQLLAALCITHMAFLIFMNKTAQDVKKDFEKVHVDLRLIGNTNIQLMLRIYTRKVNCMEMKMNEISDADYLKQFQRK